MTTILYILIAFLGIVLLVQSTRIGELLAELNNKNINDITDKDNDRNGILYFIVLVVFLVFVIWQMVAWNKFLLPDATSIHGLIIDGLMSFTMNTILIAFFILTPLLAYFVLKYRGNSKRKAHYITHSNKLEVVWTVIPAIFLTGVIIYGLRTWDKAMNVDTTNAMVVEVYAKQFDWTARYSGEDNKLGYANYKLVEGPNQLGVDLEDINAHDDIVTKEIHLVKDKQVLFKFRSQDVIHSAFLPHFRVQMNCVPGMITQFAFTPTKTTNEMKEQEGEDFEYILLCNKICGAAHYNMQIKVIVETQEEYDNWINQQKILKNTLTLK